MGKIKKIIAFLIALLPLFTSMAIPVFASATYSYDANGNQTSDGVNCYTYNDANQVSQVKNCVSDQVVAQYVYDYQGNRLVKKNYVGGTLNNTVYSPSDGYETKKLSNGSTQNTAYYYVNDDLVAKKNPDGTKNYYLSDNLHSTSILASQSGSVIESTSYYPFGAIRSGGTKSKYLYTGQENDPETSLDYYNARYYNPQIRHFTQPDNVIANPYNPQELNRYSYVENNPLRYTDPTGHITLSEVVLWGLAIYFAAAILPTYHPATIHPAASSPIANAIKNTVSNTKAATSNLSNKAATVFNKPPSKTSSGNNKGSSSGNTSGGSGSSNAPKFDPKQWVKEPSYNDPTQKPGPDWEWRGSGDPESGKGSYVRGPKGQTEILHPDLNHPDPLGPHWDYTDSGGNSFRIFPDGTTIPK